MAQYQYLGMFGVLFKSDCKLVGYYDPLTNRAQSLADKYGGKVFNSLEELLADKDIDAVSVCTSNKYHASITIDALKSWQTCIVRKTYGNFRTRSAGYD